MLVPHLSFMKLGLTIEDCRNAYQKLVNDTDVTSEDYEFLRHEIRTAQKKNFAFGGEEFKKEMGAKLGLDCEGAEVEATEV